MVVTVQSKLQELHDLYGSDPRVCEALGLESKMNASVWAIRNERYVSPAAYRKVKRALMPGSVKRQPRPCPNSAQVALFNELGLDTWSEVIDAGLERIRAQQQVREQFEHVMEHIKEQMEHAQG